MPSRCVAGFCSNTHENGISLFKFPKDPELRSKWIQQVRRTRDKWFPSPTSVLCSEHFEIDCFDTVPSIKRSLGCQVQHKRVLLPTAVPTVFRRNARKPNATAAVITSPGVSFDVSFDGAGFERQSQHDTSSTLKKVRTCVQKRQKIQVLSDAFAQHEQRVEAETTIEASLLNCDASCQADIPKRIKTRTVSVAVKPKSRVKGKI
uniref:THAP domain-containing protein 2-like n=1 Tax=Ciona intestinalis TaxID=7719 RepID=UPI000EF50B96|nr:THAP domain-containing protein 2-like [Ciona intestinalis]|eukprot:XP_026695328.1 THAP domain-containing protein 2-like [Ciona intestinalis]